MIFVTGPRQIGKTFLAKQIMEEFQNPQYLNYDNPTDRKIIKNLAWKLNLRQPQHVKGINLV